MIVYTDSTEFGTRVAHPPVGVWAEAPHSPEPGMERLLDRLFDARARYAASDASDMHWPCLVAIASADRSQFDALVALGREGADLPDGVACLAGAGRGLHGQRGRAWSALSGNVHLSVWLAPPQATVRSPIEVLAMAAVSVVETIDGLPGLAGRAGIKWVNDILVDGAKVCGMLTHVETRPAGIRAILGIGLNVESVPEVPPTPFVPAVTALRAVSSEPDACRLGSVLHRLLVALDRNYADLRTAGPEGVFARYRARSLALGHEVALCEEIEAAAPRVIAEGRAIDLGPQLELVLAGHARPFTTGRLILRDG